MDACEGQAVEVIEIDNAFLHAHNYERVLMILRRELAEMMVRIDPSMYREYITYSKNGVLMLYAFLSKALYGMLRDILLLYKCLRLCKYERREEVPEEGLPVKRMGS